MRPPVALLALFLAAGLLLSAQAQETPASAIEPSVPAPTAAVQKVLDEVAALAKEKKAAEALAAADRVLAIAREAKDAPGEALAQVARGEQLEALNRREEAAPAWKEAAAAWERAGDGPGRIQALCRQALLLSMVGKESEADILLNAALNAGETERQRPVAAAFELNQGAVAFFRRGSPNAARRLFLATFGIQEKLAPGSLNGSFILNNLGAVATDQGDLAGAKRYHEQALEIQEKLAPGSLDVAFSLNNLGGVVQVQGDLAGAKRLYEQALAIAIRLAPGSGDVAFSLTGLGNVASDQGNLAGAKRYYEQALEIREKLAPGSLEVAEILHNLGSTVQRQGDLAAARRCFEQSLEIRQKLAPGSGDVAYSLTGLGNVAHLQGDRATAKRYHQQTLEIVRTRNPDSLQTADMLSNLGGVALDGGELAEAKRYLEQALEIQKRLAPGSLLVAGSLSKLGGVAGVQGDLAGAKRLYEQALAIREGLAPGSLDVADGLIGLGLMAEQQGDLAGAKRLHERALAIYERLAPGSLGVVASLNNLGEVAQKQGDLVGAKQLYKQALAMQEKLAPGALDIAFILNNAGEVDTKRGDLAGAQRYFEQSLEIKQRLAPDSLDVASSMKNLGNVAASRGDWDRAEALSRQAWTIIRHQAAAVSGDEARQAFGHTAEVYAASLLRCQLRRGDAQGAFATLEEGRAQALQQLLAERGLTEKLVAPDVWKPFQTALAARNQAQRMLEVARGDVEQARRRLDAQKTQAAEASVLSELLGRLEAATAVIPRREAEETDARLKLGAAWDAVKRSAPQTLGEPLSLAAARAALPPGTLLAAFAVGQEESTLLLVGREGPVRGFHLNLSNKQLAARVTLIRNTLALGLEGGSIRARRSRRRSSARWSRGDGEALPLLADSPMERDAALRSLFHTLFPPKAAAAVAKAKRLLISPDDVLWDLPFAALRAEVFRSSGVQGSIPGSRPVPDRNTRSPQYLGLLKPISYTPSLSVYAYAVREARRASSEGPALVAVGNPVFSRERRAELLRRAVPASGAPASKPTAKPQQLASAAPRRRSGERSPGERGLLTREAPAPLPGAEDEASVVARLYGTTPSIGVEPTEAWLRQRAPSARVLHLATHGYYNSAIPSASGVLLAVPEKEPGIGETDNDGVLQAWELYDPKLRLNAELVVLSACETGLGQKVAGEGLVGLTRAFQVAGARSIVASRWRVSDERTEKLMVLFHQKLRRGLAKDEALRQAMVAVHRERPDPYYWAPFFLVGDPENGGLGAPPPTPTRSGGRR
jgi:tetratricopeptide (TPR) repeat protein